MTSISYVSTSTEATNNASTSTDTDTTSTLSEEKEIFLNILLTQLENQNPLDPVDTTEFTNQLVAYSSLEQEMTINQNLETVVSTLKSANALSAFSYLGTDVEIDSPVSIMQDGEAEWSYILEDDAENVTLQVLNSSGEVLASYGVEEGSAGTYSMTIASSDLAEEVEDGTVLYLSVIATDAEGEDIKTDAMAVVTVDGVESSEEATTLTAGSLIFTTDDVIAMRQSVNDNNVSSSSSEAA